MRLRPRHRFVTKIPQQEILERIRKALRSGQYQLAGNVVQEHAFISLPEQTQSYWSPEMHVWVREDEGSTIVYGVIGPKPKIWTMFVFLYTAVVTSTFLGGSYGIIQLWLGIKAQFLWSIPIGIIAIAAVYGAANFGQYKGKEQMLVLQNFLENIMTEAPATLIPG